MKYSPLKLTAFNPDKLQKSTMDFNSSKKGKKPSYERHHSNTVKKFSDVSKKMQNVEYLIKIEEKNKKQLIDKYEKQINKIEKFIEKTENDLKQVLKELNEKEALIYEIQKDKLESFKEDLTKLNSVYDELDEKSSSLKSTIEELRIKESIHYNLSGMLEEDLNSHKNEISLQKIEFKEKKEILINIEKSFPKDFDFMLEDIQIEKDLLDIKNRKKNVVYEIEKLEKSMKEVVNKVEYQNKEKQICENEIEKSIQLIKAQSKENTVSQLEDYIIKNVTDLLQFEKIKTVLTTYFNQKNFDIELQINLGLKKNLEEKKEEMIKEFREIRIKKQEAKQKIEKDIEDIRKKNNNYHSNMTERSKIDAEIKTKTNEINLINKEIQSLDIDFEKKKSLFDKYIFLLENRCQKAENENYFENENDVLDSDFDDNFKEELFNLIDSENILEQEKIKNKNLIDIYYRELGNREKLIQNSLSRRKTYTDKKSEILVEIDKLKIEIDSFKNRINEKNKIIAELNQTEKILYERVEQRNRNLSSNIEKSAESKFENYLKEKEKELKEMKKIYGNKVLEKLFKQQRQTFLEQTFVEHTEKKQIINEFVLAISKIEALVNLYESNSVDLKEKLNEELEIMNPIVETKINREADETVINETKNELKEKIEEMMQNQIKEIEKDKKQLEYKFNLDYYFEKIKDLKLKIKSSLDQKTVFINELQSFEQIIEEKKKKLYLEDLDLKNNLVSMQIGINQEDVSITHLPYKTVNFGNSGEKFNPPENIEENNIENKEEVNEFEDFKSNFLSKPSLNITNIDLPKKTQDQEENKEQEEQPENSYKNIHSKKDPTISLSLEKIQPLLDGINLYKNFDSQSTFKNKIFDPLNAKNNPPESCGYALRSFKLNPNDETIECRNTKAKHLELKINVNEIKGISLSKESKSIIKNKKELNKKPNNYQIEKLIQNDFLTFSIILSKGSLELIASNYSIFSSFQTAIEELIAQKKNIYAYLKI